MSYELRDRATKILESYETQSGEIVLPGKAVVDVGDFTMSLPATTTPASWNAGDRVLEEWEILSRKDGGEGVVYEMAPKGCPEDSVAAKTIGDSKEWRESARERLQREFTINRYFSTHPNVVSAYTFRTLLGRPLSVMEYARKGSLADFVRATPDLSDRLPTVLRLAVQCCVVLQDLLDTGLKCHGDIKPSNLLIRSDPESDTDDPRTWILAVSDFGNARVSALLAEFLQVSAGDLDHEGFPNGTPEYMAPELFTADRPSLSRRTDVYAFGISLFVALFGEHPLRRDLPARLAGPKRIEWLHDIHDRIRARVPSVFDVSEAEWTNPVLDGYLSPILTRCLSIDPDQRPGFRELAQEFLVVLCEFCGPEWASFSFSHSLNEPPVAPSWIDRPQESGEILERENQAASLAFRLSPDDAERELRRVEDSSTDGTSWYSAGIALATVDEIDLSIRFLRESIRRDPKTIA
ncbi:MAG: protein kinase, partial [Planctomycetota bacterium]